MIARSFEHGSMQVAFDMPPQVHHARSQAKLADDVQSAINTAQANVERSLASAYRAGFEAGMRSARRHWLCRALVGACLGASTAGLVMLVAALLLP